MILKVEHMSFVPTRTDVFDMCSVVSYEVIAQIGKRDIDIKIHNCFSQRTLKVRLRMRSFSYFVVSLIIIVRFLTAPKRIMVLQAVTV